MSITIKSRNFLNGVVWLSQIFCLLGIWIQPILAETTSEIVQRSEVLMQGKLKSVHTKCIFRVRPTDNARFEIDGLKVDQKINYQEWSGESLSAERRADYEIYHQLAKEMEHLIQHSQYGKLLAIPGLPYNKYYKLAVKMLD